jgi:toxin ParE2
MNVRFSDAALAELEQAVGWYDRRCDGLGEQLLDEVETARARIVERPHAWQKLGDGARRFRLRRFPYGLIYLVDGEDIVILAVAHLHRKPDYWRERLQTRRTKD